MIPRLRLGNKEHPRVDVLITCAGEDESIVLNTTVAACASDYPSDRFRVVVLDDAGSATLRASIDKLRQTWPNLYYTARTKGKIHHFKAGNLNHGYNFVKTLPGGSGEYIAALDADMIPDPVWLRALLPHLMRDPKTALAQCPQAFYNVPCCDPLSQGLDSHFNITEAMKERLDSTQCAGTGYVLRRAALDDIGGFPTGTVVEDYHCSIKLLCNGWTTIYVDEYLQHGKVTESFEAHVKQQSRWHIGHLQNASLMGFYLWRTQCRSLSGKQRLVGLLRALHPLSLILTAFSILIMPLTLLSGRSLVVYPQKGDLGQLLRLASTFTICQWLDHCIVALIVGYGVALSEAHSVFWSSPYHAVAIIKAFLPQWVHAKAYQFTPSGGGTTSIAERDSKHRLIRKVKTALWNQKIGFHIAYVIICTICLAHGMNKIIRREYEDKQAFLVEVLIHFGWPPVLWLVCLGSFGVPIQCAFGPPTYLTDEQALSTDPDTGASYPKTGYEKLHREGADVFYISILAYNVAIFVWSWYL